MAAYKDYYAVLGVPKTASQQEIRAAFRKLAAKHHPDRNPGNAQAEETFKEINEAYTVLSDEEKRSFYDRYGSADNVPPFANGAAGGSSFNFDPNQAEGFSDFFQSIFGRGYDTSNLFGNRGRGRSPFADVAEAAPRAEGSIRISLETAYQGGSTTVRIDDKRVDVGIPKGTRDGAKLRLRGQAPGGGDVYLTVKLEPHPRFSLEGDHVRVIVDVPDHVAVLGGNVRVPTLDGDVEMTLPPGTQAGRVLRLRGQGWLRRDGSRGDELAEVRVVIPSSLSEEQRDLYRQLKALHSADTANAAD